MPSKEELIKIQEDTIEMSLSIVAILKKIEIGGTYFVDGCSGFRDIVRITELGYRPEIKGVLLASEVIEPLTDPENYSMWIKFIRNIEPFNKVLAPLCVNWEFISQEFKDTFNKGV